MLNENFDCLRQAVVSILISAGIALTACAPFSVDSLLPIVAQAELEGFEQDWSGYRVHFYQEGVAMPLSSSLQPDGTFEIPFDILSMAKPVTVEVRQQELRLRALMEGKSTQVTANTSARLALADKNGNGTLEAEELGSYQQASGKKADAVHNALHAVFYSRQHPKISERDLLDRYADSWSLAQSLANHAGHQPDYLTSFQLRFHDVLVYSNAVIKGKAKPYQDNAFNPELNIMLRLSNKGQPLRWQHFPYEQQSWACTDYFEKRVRWQLGVRFWAVAPEFSSEVSLEQTADTIQSLIAAQHCGNSDWRLPTTQELITLTDPRTAEWRFPLSLPFNQLGNFWALDEHGKTLVFDLRRKAVVEGSHTAVLLPLAFSADTRLPKIVQNTTPVDLKKLRQLYSQPAEQWPEPTLDEAAHFTELGSLPPVPFPKGNPYSKEKVELGQTLFFDPNFSKNNNVACASCHIPQQHWGDSRRLSPGTDAKNGKRNAMPILNTAYNFSQFWDGRVGTLEEQSLHPVMDQLEMALTLDELLARIKEDIKYPALFKAAFGDEKITLDRFKKSVATFERTLISQPGDFDRFLAGDQQAMTDEQIWGLHLFRTKARCANCHSGPTLSDNTIRNTGLTYYGRSLEDTGRFAVNHRKESMGAFRIPPLRDIAFTAPYMHNGVFPILARGTKNGSVVGVLAMYNAGMTKGRNANYPQYVHKYDPFFPVIDDMIQALGLGNEEMLALDAFLKSVSAPSRTTPAPYDVLVDPQREIIAH